MCAETRFPSAVRVVEIVDVEWGKCFVGEDDVGGTPTTVDPVVWVIMEGGPRLRGLVGDLSLETYVLDHWS